MQAAVPAAGQAVAVEDVVVQLVVVPVVVHVGLVVPLDGSASAV